MNDQGCESYRRLTRRAFLGSAGAAGAGAMLGFWNPRLLWAAADPSAQADSVIFLWMSGGQSHVDTWDPKPGTPQGGPFQALETAVSGIRISEHLPRIARWFADVALIRSLTGKEGNHERATYQMHTGRLPGGSSQYSTLGSVAVHELVQGTPALPPYVTINGNRWPAGHLGSAWGAFHVGNATEAARDLTHHHSVDGRRFNRRVQLLRRLDRPFARAHQRAEVIQAYADHYDAAFRLMKSPEAKVFDLALEKDAVREAYGITPFGQGCLLARRLVRAGVRFVEVTLGGWDTHDDNFKRVAEQSAILDRALATLLDDLRDKDLLHRTLVVLCSEFGRTPIINARSGRDHWPRVRSALLAGGGIAGGRVVGASTADGGEVRDRSVQIDDLQATICYLLGLNARKKIYGTDNRPIRIIERRGAAPVAELLAQPPATGPAGQAPATATP